MGGKREGEGWVDARKCEWGWTGEWERERDTKEGNKGRLTDRQDGGQTKIEKIDI